MAPCSIGGLFGELEALYGRDVSERRLAFSRPDREIVFSADAGQLRQALVNLIKNGLEAIGTNGRVMVSAAAEDDALVLEIADDGPGLTAERRANPFVPGFTSKADGSGLGLTIVERIVNDHGGTIAAASGTATGTTFRIRLPRERRI
jgi:two-component system sensor histidine kinase HydH